MDTNSELVVGSPQFKELDDIYFNLPLQKMKERRKEYNKMYYQTRVKPIKLQQKEENRIIYELHVDLINEYIVNNLLNKS